MGIVINLLPDLRQAKLREQRRRQFAVGIAISVWVVCVASILLMFLYSAGQKLSITIHDKNIAATTDKLNQVTGLTDALTAQQHLNSLGTLYSNRVLFTQFFDAYQASSPADIALDTLKVDADNLLVVDGTAKSFAAIAKLQRALEQSHVTVGPSAAASNSPYFSAVNIKSAVNTNGKGIVFNINAKVSPEVLNAK